MQNTIQTLQISQINNKRKSKTGTGHKVKSSNKFITITEQAQAISLKISRKSRENLFYPLYYNLIIYFLNHSTPLLYSIIDLIYRKPSVNCLQLCYCFYS